jgi:P2 family phage contractile tail tube protein
MDAVEVTIRRHTELDLGNAKAGDNSQFKVKSSISYYKLAVNGEVWCEIDHLNFIETIFGVDAWPNSAGQWACNAASFPVPSFSIFFISSHEADHY